MHVLEVEGLTKRFRSGWSKRMVDAVTELRLSINEGSVVAFVGPNGAGKTTTLLMMLGFLRPDRGTVSIFGETAGSPAAKRRLGFQSEIFYSYPFHTARRALGFYGRLSGMSESDLASRVPPMLERLGLADAAERRVSGFSKGMMQRLGLAQALLHEPELLLLDEPTTGLDPEGRKLVADIIAEEKARGRTVFLSSHILTDVERTCDRVVMIRQGTLVLDKNLNETTQSELWEVALSELSDDGLRELSAGGFSPEDAREPLVFRCDAERKTHLLNRATKNGWQIVTVRRIAETLEELYMKHLGGSSDG